MKIADFIPFFKKAVHERIAVLLTGRPGVGKTQIPQQVCRDEGIEFQLRHPVTEEPINYEGVPAIYREEGIARSLPMGHLAIMMQATKPLLMWLDDLGQQTSTLVQGAIMQLVEARQINGKALPQCVFFGAATNRQGDGAGVAGIIQPLLNRFDCIIELEPDLKAWQSFILNRKYKHSPLFASFLEYKPDYLYKWDAKSAIESSCTPRSLEKACRILSLDLVPQANRTELLCSIVGKAAGVDLNAFIEFGEKLVNIADIERDPHNTPLPDRSTKDGVLMQYILASAFAQRLNKGNVDAYLIYAGRFTPELRVLAYRNMLAMNRPLVTTNATFSKHCVANASLYLDLE